MSVHDDDDMPRDEIGPRDGDGQVDERLWPLAVDKGQTATKHQLERCRARLDQLPA